MAAKSPHRPFTPDPEFLEALPDVKGNDINGLGEAEIRRPRMVWWAPDPDQIAHADAQRWFYGHETDDERLMAERAKRREVLERPVPDVAETPAERAPEDWTAALSQFVDSGDCEMTGVARMRPEWVYQHHETDYETVIMLGVQHDYDELKSAPDVVCGTEVTRQYVRAASAAKVVAGWLREQGWDAQPVSLGIRPWRILLKKGSIMLCCNSYEEALSCSTQSRICSYYAREIQVNVTFAPCKRWCQSGKGSKSTFSAGQPT